MNKSAQIRNIELSKIQLNEGQIPGLPKNPRFLKDERFKALVKSIEDDPEMLSLRECIVYPNGTKFVVIAGNMRYRACLQLGYKDIPCKVLPKETPVEKLRAYTIKDNISFGSEDWDALANEWEETELKDFGMTNIGIKPEVEEDDFEIPDKIKTKIKLGDLIEIGDHRLLCGDSADNKCVEKLMDGKSAQMVFTDPPYGVAIGKKNRMLNSFQKAGRNLEDIADDGLKPDDLYAKLLPAFKNIALACDPVTATIFVTAPQGGGLGMMMMMMMMRDAGLTVRHVLIWKKNSPTFSMGRLDYDYQHEPILLTWLKSHKYYGLGEHRTSVWEIDKPRSSKEHPTMKPVKLVANALMNNSKEGDVCVDFFIGSGTTIVACEQLKRKCYGIEIEPKYCQVTVDRMLNLNPKLKVKINGKIYENVQQTS